MSRSQIRWIPTLIVIVLVAALTTTIILMTNYVDGRLDDVSADIQNLAEQMDTTTTTATVQTTTTSSSSTSTTSTTLAEVPQLYSFDDNAVVEGLEFTINYVIYPSPADFAENFDSPASVRQVAWSKGEHLHQTETGVVAIPDGVNYIEDPIFGNHFGIWGTYTVLGSTQKNVFDYELQARSPEGTPLNRLQEDFQNYGGTVVPRSKLRTKGVFELPFPMETITVQIPMGTVSDGHEIDHTEIRVFQISMLEPVPTEEG